VGGRTQGQERPFDKTHQCSVMLEIGPVFILGRRRAGVIGSGGFQGAGDFLS